MAGEVKEQRRLAAIMFTDMVGYSALVQQNEEFALKLLDAHRQLLRPLFEKHLGREIKTIGDAFLVEFHSALDAVRCALDMQKVLTEYNASSPKTSKLEIRIGIHVGDVVHREGDVFGDGVNIAARIEPLAEAGGICISEDVARQVQGKVDAPLVELGRGELKNIRLPVKIYRLELPWDGRHSTFTHRLRFRLRQKSTRRALMVAAVTVVVCAIYLSSTWNTKHSGDNGLTGGPTATLPTHLDRYRLAILPLESINLDEQSKTFAVGMTEELNTKLTKIRELTVVPQRSVSRFADKDIRTIGRELGVGTVLEGSVRREENQLRIVLRLTDVATEKQLWANNYDREEKQIFAIQTALAQSVADVLQIQLLASERQALEEAPTDDLEAYKLYVEGRVYLNQATADGATRAIELFQKAVKRDPKFFLAFTELARAYTWMEKFYEPGKGWDQKALSAIDAALSLSPDLPEAYVARGEIFFTPARKWDAASAVKDFRRALRAKPNLPIAHEGLAFVYLHCGLLPEAVKEAREVLNVDPANNPLRAYLSQALQYQGNYAEAFRERSKLGQDYAPWARGNVYAMSLFYLGHTNEAVAG